MLNSVGGNGAHCHKINLLYDTCICRTKHKLFLFKHVEWRLVRQIFQPLENRLPNQGKKRERIMHLYKIVNVRI